MMDPKELHMLSMDSRCSGQSREILYRSNQTVDRAPLMGVYGLKVERKVTGQLHCCKLSVRSPGNKHLTFLFFSFHHLEHL